MQLVKYEIRERHIGSELWSTVAWFDNIDGARNYWSTTAFDGVEAKLIKIEYTETVEHYHSADGGTFW